jgi:hypothetical protein
LATLIALLALMESHTAASAVADAAIAVTS